MDSTQPDTPLERENRRILVAEDDRSTRQLLEKALSKWGFEVLAVDNGRSALEQLQAPDAPRLALLDWMMPELQGPEVCRLLRQDEPAVRPYLIMLTAKTETTDMVSALQTGADDYISKPFNIEELMARIEVGLRTINLQLSLAARVEELQEALQHIEVLQGLLPICSYCRNIRNDQESWQSLEGYIEQHTEAIFSHGICPECLKAHFPKLWQRKFGAGK